MVIVPFSFCGCQWQGWQQPQSTFQRLAHGRCAYSEMPVAERDELSSAVACSIHHWMQGCGPRRNQQMESHYLDDQAPLIRSCGCASYGDTEEEELERMRQVPRQACSQRQERALSSMPWLILEAVHSAYAKNINIFHYTASFGVDGGWFRGWF